MGFERSLFLRGRSLCEESAARHHKSPTHVSPVPFLTAEPLHTPCPVPCALCPARGREAAGWTRCGSGPHSLLSGAGALNPWPVGQMQPLCHVVQPAGLPTGLQGAPQATAPCMWPDTSARCWAEGVRPVESNSHRWDQAEAAQGPQSLVFTCGADPGMLGPIPTPCSGGDHPGSSADRLEQRQDAFLRRKEHFPLPPHVPAPLLLEPPE